LYLLFSVLFVLSVLLFCNYFVLFSISLFPKAHGIKVGMAASANAYGSGGGGGSGGGKGGCC
jgi:hypothetical protein